MKPKTSGARPKAVAWFRSEAAERKFRETHDATGHVDRSKAARAKLPNLEPSTHTISLRIPVGLLERIKVEANKRDVPYQPPIKIRLREKAG